MKNKNLKKILTTTTLLGALALVNIAPVRALEAPNRNFWDMSIRSYKNTSQLTSRNKETNNRESYLKVTAMSGTTKSIYQFSAYGYNISYYKTIDKNNSSLFNTALKFTYMPSAHGDKGAPIFLTCRNYNYSKTTGLTSGVVNYQ